MKKVTIWHNPRCSKSRETLALLQSRDIEPEIVEYLKTPPSIEEIERALQLLNLKPEDLIRKSEEAYLQSHLDRPDVTRNRLMQAMHEYPILIQRPVVFANGKARIGRPPESVLEIL